MNRDTLRIITTVFITFVGFLFIALPLAVLPTYVHSVLGFSPAVAGLTISAQYVATIVTRPWVGQLCDRLGPRKAVLFGFGGGVVSGALTLAAAAGGDAPLLTLGLLLLGRLALGTSESWIGTGAISWAVGQVGPEHTVRIISWNGIATYGALALGAPLGSVLAEQFGFGSIGTVTIALCGLGFVLALRKPAVAVSRTKPLGTRSVFALVLPYGLVMALGSIGFGVIAAFIVLFFASRGWGGAPFALTMFGIAFIVSRLLLSGTIVRYGGLRVTLPALVVELVGLLAIAAAPTPAVAMAGAALTGFGFSPVFPALGGAAVGRVPAQSRGAALGLYTVFLDLALAVQGPLAGLLIERLGPASPFGLGAAAVAIGIAATALLLAR